MKRGKESVSIIFVNLFPVIKNGHILIWCVKNTQTRVHAEAMPPPPGPPKKVEIKMYSADGST
jgi:hypothetical protein